MKRFLLSLFLSTTLISAFAQTVIYCTGTSGSYQSGWTDGVTRYEDSMKCTGTTKAGYAVFDLSSIPAGSIISSVNLVFSTLGVTAGTTGVCNTYGYNGDLSLVTDPATLFADINSGTLLASGTGSAPGGYGLAPYDSISIYSTSAPFTSFIATNLGSKISLCFTGGGSVEYTIRGYLDYMVPRLRISYTAPCSGTPGPSYIITSNTLSCNLLTTTISDASYYPTAGNSFQWQSSPDSITWTNISGATNLSYNNTGITATTYFRDVVTCSYSGLTGYSAGKKLNYAPCCTGMPTPAAATASATFCDGCSFTLNIPGYTTQAGLTDQWQYSVDSITWFSNLWYTSLPTTVPCTLINRGGFYYRDMQTCSIGGGFTGFSPGIYVGFPYSLTNYISQPPCGDPTFTATIHGLSPDLYVKTMFGDGSYDSVLATLDSIGAYSMTTHHYAFPGTYTVNQILYNNNNFLANKLALVNEYPNCQIRTYSFFSDTNLNCNKDTGEYYVLTPLQFIVDSNGVTIDTITTTSGFNYSIHGSIGTIYRYTALCPILFCDGTNIFTDTVLSTSTTRNKMFGIHCTSTSGFDFVAFESPLFTRGEHMAKKIYTGNYACNSMNAVVTVTYSPKYTFMGDASPTPSAIAGNTLSWNVNELVLLNTNIVTWRVENNPVTGHLWAGDTVHTCVTITPTTGDLNPANNTECVIDTVTSSYDPNEMFVSPSYCLPSDTATVPLQYTINFTNVGNDTAFNIYVLDTLPDFVDPMSMKIVAATDTMFTTRMPFGGHNVVKFEFPHINLRDTAECPLCMGGVVFSANLKPNLPDGTVITNQAGVYFDYNPVCLTNAVTNVTGCWVNAVPNVASADNIAIYPNPTNDILHIDVPEGRYTEAVVTNQLGQVIKTMAITDRRNTLDVQNLPSGLYFVTLHGQNGTRTLKFVKAE